MTSSLVNLLPHLYHMPSAQNGGMEPPPDRSTYFCTTSIIEEPEKIYISKPQPLAVASTQSESIVAFQS